ncbi:transglycosylase SLT domain-containing protein [Rhizobium leguminosarum bv. viciae]|jgi:soluble lytic murein transglycosylase-like protein|uniref:Lytic transglycosylase domain-containing protein n=2 Tax=Rhizobium TaxID=379 RepID=A0A4R3R138_9HYPH|nr:MULTISPECIES: lytic transglycosylase domain-containing protein [Rhizobium]MBN9981937.1 lytic transglycosylase domain-containing protein [Rhizobium laguerreae]MBY3063665.1 lytic transglycosylase domain-containing protein [Rhizobium laguerreae]MBY3069224.1 lytic transglycosylase domain-containing protein [Rhizobium laguerreae]MBY3078513.1 lytic transglycosylase domain-containing protein [Rhizobium laguerreae]MBY3084650.1 lytic transglycosylase domain-containing protein [Rhizobium laguerreae]
MRKLIVVAATCVGMVLAGNSFAFANDWGVRADAPVKKVERPSKKAERPVKKAERSVKPAKRPLKTAERPLKTVERQSGYPVANVSGNSYSVLISKYANQYDVPVALATAVIRIESNFNPNARGSHGEIGLMQIKPATARMMGYSGSAKGLFDPETNIKYGMKYLAAAHDLGGGETCNTILKYNAGHGATRMNPVSKSYCGKVLAML